MIYNDSEEYDDVYGFVESNNEDSTHSAFNKEITVDPFTKRQDINYGFYYSYVDSNGMKKDDLYSFDFWHVKKEDGALYIGSKLGIIPSIRITKEGEIGLFLRFRPRLRKDPNLKSIDILFNDDRIIYLKPQKEWNECVAKLTKEDSEVLTSQLVRIIRFEFVNGYNLDYDFDIISKETNWSPESLSEVFLWFMIYCIDDARTQYGWEPTQGQ